MNAVLSPNTQATLLLTAPLMTVRGGPVFDCLTPGEFRRLAAFLRSQRREPADLLDRDADALIDDALSIVDSNRLRRLLDRGFLLSQALERWQARAFWVMSNADEEYPRILRERLKEDAPAILYGCGDVSILESGGLAIVGSRNVGAELIEFTQSVGRLAASAGRTVVSGGARGIDQAAMRGALDAGGRAVGVLADSLERTALNREHRNLLMREQLVLISLYDPLAGFNVGHAMQRNKVIYALADAALVVNADYQKGGTWAGAVEQLDKLQLVPIYVRIGDGVGKGLEALREKGALPWPNPRTTDEFDDVFTAQPPSRKSVAGQEQMSLLTVAVPDQSPPSMDQERPAELPFATQEQDDASSPADILFATVRELLARMDAPRKDSEVADALNVSKAQAKVWLERLVDEGVLEKLERPVRYRARRATPSQGSLFRE